MVSVSKETPPRGTARVTRVAVETLDMDIRRVRRDDELADALAIRRTVFIEEQGVPVDRELDGKDDEALHLIGYLNTEAVATARLLEIDDSTGKVERVAVLPAYRGNGYGMAIMDAVETSAASCGYDELILHAQLDVVGFYEYLDYEVSSDVFTDAGIPHREMRKTV